YSGTVFHRRLKPRAHSLKYRIFMLLIDLDEAEGLTRRLRWLRSGRFGLMSFREKDFGDRSDMPLKAQIGLRLAEANLAGGGPIRLLTMPRILGYGFNPLSVFFCHARNGQLSAILYEVSNTFGQRHAYLMPVAESDGPVRQAVDKAFHVSPFMDMDLLYRFSVAPPVGAEGESTTVNIAVDDAEGPLLLTGFTGQRQSMTDANLLKAWFGHPLLTLKVIAGIHWEAVKLMLKGLRLRGGVVPEAPVTVGRSTPTYSATLAAPGAPS
ncbi:MAG: DUF1365 domain-containing protein, partial [Caulobacteraceae bacterium]